MRTGSKRRGRRKNRSIRLWQYFLGRADDHLHLLLGKRKTISVELYASLLLQLFKQIKWKLPYARSDYQINGNEIRIAPASTVFFSELVKMAERTSFTSNKEVINQTGAYFETLQNPSFTQNLLNNPRKTPKVIL